jgi:hypothetical protein
MVDAVKHILTFGSLGDYFERNSPWCSDWSRRQTFLFLEVGQWLVYKHSLQKNSLTKAHKATPVIQRRRKDAIHATTRSLRPQIHRLPPILALLGSAGQVGAMNATCETKC